MKKKSLKKEIRHLTMEVNDLRNANDAAIRRALKMRAFARELLKSKRLSEKKRNEIRETFGLNYIMAEEIAAGSVSAERLTAGALGEVESRYKTIRRVLR